MKVQELSLLVLRLSLGVLFFWAGLVKVTAQAPFSAAGYLKGSSGPLAEFFQSLSGIGAIDFLVMWGLTLGGLALLTGVFTRLAALGLSIMMALIYLSRFPPSTGLIDEHLVYIASLLVVASFSAEKFWGLGKYAKRWGLWFS